MIVWTRVTWYSKLLAAVFFIFLFPALTFFLGKEYAYTEKALENQTPSAQSFSQEDRSGFSRSGIAGQVLYEDGQPFQGSLLVYQENNIVTETIVRADGKFLLFLEVGEYTLAPQEESLGPLPVLVEPHTISHITISG